MAGDARPIPYPADTRAKGWRFELDYERIEQSDTWPLAAEVPMCQHALLMMWLVAWVQVPCGSFPADEALIRSKCRIPTATWAKCRDILMRGWWLAEDGRMYHDTLVLRVVEMMKRRRSDSDRQAAKRARDASDDPVTHGNVTRDTPVTPPGVHPESSTDNRQPNTDNREPKKHKPARKRAAPAELVSVDDMVGEGVDRQHATDWLAARAEKKLILTVTAWEQVRDEAAKAGLSVPEAIKTAAGNGWGGFKAKWLHGESAGPAPSSSVSRQSALEQRNAAVARQLMEKEHAPG